MFPGANYQVVPIEQDEEHSHTVNAQRTLDRIDMTISGTIEEDGTTVAFIVMDLEGQMQEMMSGIDLPGGMDTDDFRYK